MRGTRLRPTRRNEGGAVGRNGFVLVLVIFFIVLASSLTVLVMASSVQLVRTTRHQHESLLLRQLTDSARAWARAHSNMRTDDSVTLRGEGILPEGVSGAVEITVDGELPNVVVIRAQVSFPGRESARTTRFMTTY